MLLGLREYYLFLGHTKSEQKNSGIGGVITAM